MLMEFNLRVGFKYNGSLEINDGWYTYGYKPCEEMLVEFIYITMFLLIFQGYLYQ